MELVLSFTCERDIFLLEFQIKTFRLKISASNQKTFPDF
jgi:hypothetical protein